VRGEVVRRAVEGVDFDDFQVNGKRWKEAPETLKVEHASGVRFQ
jgi:hypothetical protein